MAPRATDFFDSLRRRRCCPPPPEVTGITAQPGGGSGEISVTWDPLPAGAGAVMYRVYQRKGVGTWWLVAVVTDDALGALAPGRLGIVDAADFWPWPSGWIPQGARCYSVTAVSNHGLEGPLSAEVCGNPP
ncbi:MAG: hypothetical protein SGJ13_13165 [Actinomycetota bacterium]|nr:hypothetical protein [Actinomycetota bacterium]